MTVYIVSMGFDYEGECLPDEAYDSLDRAEAWVEAQAKDREWPMGDMTRNDRGGVIQYEYGGSHFSVSRLEVK